MSDRVSLRELVHTLDGAANGACDPLQAVPATLWRMCQDAVLLHEGATAQFVYVVRSGSLKRLRTLEDGYEQVLSFAQAGELLGFDALHNGRQPATVMALEDVTAYALPVQGLLELRLQFPVLDQALQRALSRQLLRTAGTTEMMAAVASEARLARFLLWMSQCMAELGQSPRRLLLRMCRRDIASLLGVAHETVSRSFTMLADMGLVKVENREVDILDLDGLRQRARYTRRPSDEPAGQAAPRTADWTPRLQSTWFPQADLPVGKPG